MKRDTELWLLVREIRAEYWRMGVMFERWGNKLGEAEDRLKAILDDPDAPAPQAENQSAASSSGAGASSAWDEQTR